MSAHFTRASSQRMTTTPGFAVSYPFTVGVWVRPASVGSLQNIWVLSTTANDLNFWVFGIAASGAVRLEANYVASETTETVTAGGWVFIVARISSATDRRLHWIPLSGGSMTVASSSNTSSVSPTGINTMAIACWKAASGEYDFFDGEISEWWIAGSDPFATGQVPTAAAMLDLGLGGPFKAGVKNLWAYESFRLGPTPAVAEGDIAGARHAWTLTGGPRIGVHPPLPYWYERQSQTPRHLVI